MINHTNENNNTEIQCKFGDAIRELGICRLLKESNIRKKKGGSEYEIFQFLLLLVFQNCNLFHFLNSKKQDMAFSKNTCYRFLNDLGYNWQRFLTLLSARVVAFNRAGNVSGSVTVTTKKFNIPVKLVFVRNRNKAGEYIILLTTDCSLNNSEVVRLYGNRWNIELFSGPGNPCSAWGANSRGSATT